MAKAKAKMAQAKMAQAKAKMAKAKMAKAKAQEQAKMPPNRRSRPQRSVQKR